MFSGCTDCNNCKCKLEHELKKDFAEPLTVGNTATPRAQIKINNGGSEPSYNARLMIKSEIPLKEHPSFCKSTVNTKKIT